MERELIGLATDGGGSHDAALTRRSRRPIERLSVPGSTLLVGSMSGQALSMPLQRTSWERRSSAASPATSAKRRRRSSPSRRCSRDSSAESAVSLRLELPIGATEEASLTLELSAATITRVPPLPELSTTE
jgi:hypothetical protein